MNENNKMPHNGQLLKRIMDEKRYTQTNLGNEIGAQSVTIFRLIEKASITSEYLWKLSKAININLFTILAQQHPVKNPTTREIELEKQVMDLQKEVSIYKDLLKK